VFGLAKNVCIGILASIIAAAFPARSSTHVAPVSAIRSLPYTVNGAVLNKMQKILDVPK